MSAPRPVAETELGIVGLLDGGDAEAFAAAVQQEINRLVEAGCGGGAANVAAAHAISSASAAVPVDMSRE